ncbi:GNAT family N-acetyltransferase [bacterium]|nr:GNAT family N-acetyltransferase [bacterium]MBU1650656.1 GNAT family N-acetyltransferase [bacterium]MBU1882417.1 GNAT family N-acetyltransferase [bacterium]
MLDYRWYQFDDLSARELYEILKLRLSVFIVEQECPYPELDDLDQSAWHLTGWDENGQLMGYLRLLPPDVKYEISALGRVVTVKSARKQGIGSELMTRGITKAEKLFPEKAIGLSAQVAAQPFYRAMGFDAVGEMYDEDGIPHIKMIRPCGGLVDK